MEFFVVEQEYFKTPERELWHFDKKIFISKLIRKILLKEFKHGYNNFVANSALDFMIKNNLIKFENDQIYPIDLNKNQEAIYCWDIQMGFIGEKLQKLAINLLQKINGT